MDNSLARLDSVFLALSDATRRAVLARLCHGPAAVSDLAQPFDMALPSFLKHVRVLEGSGWIATRKQGRVRTCSLKPDTLEASQRWLLAQQHVWETRTDRLEQFVTGESQAHRASRRGTRK
jgi:DNA-binding transcriptional ArsR family regulator